MKFIHALFLGCLLLSAPFAFAEDDVDEKDVVVLTDKNFDDTLKKHKFVLVEFYAPWCGHCKNLKPAYAEAATKVKELDGDIVIAKVDATEEKDVAAKFKIGGFPTLKWFVDGEFASDFNAGRSAAEIVNWVKKKTGPPSVVLEAVADLDKAKEETVALFGYFAKLEGAEHDAFEALAAKSDDASFFKTTSAEVAKALGIAKAPGFAIGRNYPDFGFESVSSDKHATMTTKDDLADRLPAFIKAEKLPAFVEFSPETASKIFGAGIDNQVIIVAPSDSFGPKSSLRKDLITASASTRGDIVWVISKTDVDTSEPIISFFGLDKDSKDPQIVGFHATKGKKYAFAEGEKVNAANLEKFGKGVIDGTAPKKTKSAPVPKEPTEEGVTIVVGSTFDSIVKDPTKDVLFAVTAPWCGHCKALKPAYSKLAKRFKDIDSVVIAQMDGTENEVPDLEVSGFPTIMFFPAAKDAEGIAFEGSRDLKGMTKFIKEHAKTEYELPKKGDKQDDEEEEEEEKEFNEEDGPIIDFGEEGMTVGEEDEAHDEL